METNFVFPARSPTPFAFKLCRLNRVLLCHSSLLVMSAKDKKSNVFRYLKKNEVEFLARRHSVFEQTASKHILSFVLMQMFAR